MWCWWCCHPYEGEMLHLPFKYDDRKKVYDTVGNFCSWECMKAYAMDNYSSNMSGIICTNLTLMKKQAVGKLTPTSAAPNRLALKVFGGTLTIDEFRNTMKCKTVIVELPTQRYIPNNVIIYNKSSEFKKELTHEELNDKFNDIQNSTGVNEPLKLKRTKPLKRDEAGNNLEKSLGIKRTTKT
jgi:hypothetical protein